MADWNTDAQLGGQLNEISFFQTQQIKSFLEEKSFKKFIIVSSKGMGKTLLLRHKYDQIQKSPTGYTIIPKGEQADYVIMPASPDKSLVQSLKEQVFWEDLWKAALKVSMILNQNRHLNIEEKIRYVDLIEKCELPRSITDRLIANVQYDRVYDDRPSSVLSELLLSPKRDIEKYRTEGQQRFFELYLKLVRNACAVFMDSLDQELNKRFPNDLQIWNAGQTGLMKAAWELTRHNRHAKIFVTIRQEAFASFYDADGMNILGSVVLLKYSESELKQIFEEAIGKYEELSSITEFLGWERIYNGFLQRREDSFKYVERHTMGVPRWLMLLGESISSLPRVNPRELTKRKRDEHRDAFTRAVNERATELARMYIRDEMKPFFGGVDPDIELGILLRHVRTTVLTKSNLEVLNQIYLEESDNPIDHPFCLLKNIGLLGQVEKNATGTGLVQKFRRPYEFEVKYANSLSKDPRTYYLLHPSIHHYAQIASEDFKYTQIKIGNGIKWEPRDEETVAASRIFLFVSYSSNDFEIVEELVQELEQYLKVQGYIVDIWLDKWKMKSGTLFLDEMAAGIRESDFFLLFVSESSLASPAVQLEWKEQLNSDLMVGEKRIFPIVIDDTPYTEMDSFLRSVNMRNLREEDNAVKKLGDDIISAMQERQAD